MLRLVGGLTLLLAIAVTCETAGAQPGSPATNNAAALFERGDALYKRQQYREAFPVLLQAANLGHAPAQTRIGLMYDKGRGVSRTLSTAASWYAKAAAQGYAAAQFSLASMYDRGEGVPLDVRKASELFEASARQGHSRAQFAIGIQYEVGRGVPRDHARALWWFNKAAERGDDAAALYAQVFGQPGVPAFTSEDALTAYVRNHQPRQAPPPSPGASNCGNAPTSSWQCRGLSPQCSVAWMATCRSLEREGR